MKKFIKNELEGWSRLEIIWLIVAVLIIAVLSIYWKDNFIGIMMSITGVVCVILTGKGKMSCYIFGLVNTILYAYIAFGVKYYGEVMLNALYYVPMQFVGWFMWKRNLNNETKEVIKTKLSNKWRIIVLFVSILMIYFYGLFLAHLGGNQPYIDSMSTCLSVVAMILSVKRLMEQWIIWIVVDVVTIVMWAIVFMQGQDNMATLLMWVVYLLNAIFMYIKWDKEVKGRVLNV